VVNETDDEDGDDTRDVEVEGRMVEVNDFSGGFPLSSMVIDSVEFPTDVYQSAILCEIGVT
jgi:hypothetical protein